MSDIERLRKLAGIKPKQLLNETVQAGGKVKLRVGKTNETEPASFEVSKVEGDWVTLKGQGGRFHKDRLKAVKESDEDLDKQTFKQRGESSGKLGTDELLDRDTFKGSKKKVKESTIYHVYHDKITGQEKKDPVSKEKIAKLFSRVGKDRDGGSSDFMITPEEFYKQLNTKGFAKVGKIRFEQADEVTESTNEYELSIATDTFGQYKSKPLEPDFPADMGEKFSKTSAGESNDAIGDGEDGFGKEEGSEQPKDSGASTSAESKPKETPAAKPESKPEAKPEAKSEPKAEKSEKPFENYFAGDDSDDEPKAEKKSEEPKEDDEFSKKVKEAQEYYRLKHFVRSTIKESNDYAEVFMAAIKVLSEQAETLIVKYGANLSQTQEKQIAMDIAKDLSEGLQTVREAARTHGAKGRRTGNTYVFEFTDTASALMFTNYLAETTESVSMLTQNRGFIEAKVRDFAKVTK